MSFLIGGEMYAAGILQLREIIEFDVLTMIPMVSPWVRGVLNLRGEVVPVIDVALKFGLPETAVSPLTCVVIVEVELDGAPVVMGMMVDEVIEVLHLKAEEIEPPPAFGTRARSDFLIGMGVREQKLILLLDMNRVLAVHELTDLASIETDEAANVGKAANAGKEVLLQNPEPSDSARSEA